MKVYGIPNCDSVKKARKLLESTNTDYQFHDFRKDGITIEKLQQWKDVVEFSTLVNKRSTSWRELSDSEKSDLMDNQNLSILLEHPTLIKRPVIEAGHQIVVGFNQTNIEALI